VFVKRLIVFSPCKIIKREKPVIWVSHNCKLVIVIYFVAIQVVVVVYRFVFYIISLVDFAQYLYALVWS